METNGVQFTKKVLAVSDDGALRAVKIHEHLIAIEESRGTDWSDPEAVVLITDDDRNSEPTRVIVLDHDADSSAEQVIGYVGMLMVHLIDNE